MDVFISYSSKDKEWVRGELLTRIEQAGLQTFIDFRDFTRGAPSLKEMARGVKECPKTLLVLTPNYIASEWAEIESIMAQTLSPANRDLRILPLLKTPCEKPLYVGALTHIDFTDGADHNLSWQQLLTALGKPPVPEPLPRPRPLQTERFEMTVPQPEARPLRVFLCHGSEDKPSIRKLHDRLVADGVEPWLDERNILPGADWNAEIKHAVRATDAILVCLSTTSVGRAGYVQKEVRFALDVADEKPEGTIFIIPVKLDDCEIPERLRQWRWVQYWAADGYGLLLRALHTRAAQCGLQAPRARGSAADLALGKPPEPEPPPEPRRDQWFLAHPYPMPPNFTRRVVSEVESAPVPRLSGADVSAPAPTPIPAPPKHGGAPPFSCLAITIVVGVLALTLGGSGLWFWRSQLVTDVGDRRTSDVKLAEALIALKEKRFDQAEKVAEKLPTNDPGGQKILKAARAGLAQQKELRAALTQKLSEADTAFRNKHYDAAEALARAALRMEPNDPEGQRILTAAQAQQRWSGEEYRALKVLEARIWELRVYYGKDGAYSDHKKSSDTLFVDLAFKFAPGVKDLEVWQVKEGKPVGPPPTPVNKEKVRGENKWKITFHRENTLGGDKNECPRSFYRRGAIFELTFDPARALLEGIAKVERPDDGKPYQCANVKTLPKLPQE